MAVFVYDIFLWFYVAAIRIAASRNVKAKKWIDGRRKIFDKIKCTVNPKLKTVWVHCSSLGEFEQGRPVIEQTKAKFPALQLVLTFFSPSGYEAAKNYKHADHIFYLPSDSRENAKKFLDLVNPSLVMFIKYDYWYHYLNEINKRKINCILVSAVFREQQSFFKWYGRFQRQMLRCFTHIFVQNKQSKDLLQDVKINNSTVSGDTRFDRVAEVAGKFESIRPIEDFVGNGKCIVAGSTWDEDESVLQKALVKLSRSNAKLIVAPHEIGADHLAHLKKLFPTSINYSSLEQSAVNAPGSNVVIIDNIGMLSRLYKYGYITYVGGGFTKDGVHNVLEAAVYGKPVVFGSNYEKYQEAIQLVQCHGASTFSNDEQLTQILSALLNDEAEYRRMCEASQKYVQENVGSTQTILNYIEENRLLTR